jgi:hypothetical protein
MSKGVKRETIYIKNNNEWQKINPEYKDSSSKINDKYLQIVSESMPGITKEDCEKSYKKIKKNIAKEIIIDKNII